MTIINTLLSVFSKNEFKLKDAYVACSENNNESVRARIYENINVLFERIKPGVYKALQDGQEAILIEGDGRDVSFVKNNTIDCIINDHPWQDPKSNKGGTRNFTKYDTFKYCQSDFDEKYRILKEGHFLVEFIPSENANNYEYLYDIKQMAKKAGFEYYAKVPWKKGTFKANTGRTVKNTEDVLILTKGKAMSLRPDAKKNKADGTKNNFMSGAKAMLPSEFDFQPPTKSERIHQSEKPVELLQSILSYFTNESDIILDQFTGSGSSMIAAIKNHCNVIGIELSHEYCQKIKQRFIDNNYSLAIIK